MASGSSSKCGAVGRSGTNGSLPAASDDVLGVHLQSESIILRGPTQSCSEARPTHHLRANLSLFELDLVVDDYLKRPLLIPGRLLLQVALVDRPGWRNQLRVAIGRLQHPGKILCMADSDRRMCAALVRSSYVPGSARDMADGGSLQHCRCPCPCRCPDRSGRQACLGRQEAARRH